jgi:hypothetical protein
MMTMGKRKRIECSLGAESVADWQKEERSSPHDICRQRWTVFGAMNYTPNMRQNKALFRVLSRSFRQWIPVDTDIESRCRAGAPNSHWTRRKAVRYDGRDPRRRAFRQT